MLPSDQRKTLAEIAGPLGEIPRTFDRKTRRYLQMPVIHEWNASEYVASADLLMEKGNVAWAAGVMANEGIFKYQESENHALPGLVVYCSDVRSSITLGELGRIAEVLYDLYINGTDDPELKEIAAILKQDIATKHGVLVPARVSPTYRCLLSSVLYKRGHFPLYTMDVPILSCLNGGSDN